MRVDELRKKYLEFFKSKKHAIIPGASLIPENDPTVLFTTAGMHPLVPFLLGEKHPSGKRLADVQRCIRTGDIDEVGDDVHLSFFEMLGNWSLGDYFKKEAIEFSFEFLTKVLKIPIEKLAVSCFKGDKDAPKDNESAKIWNELGITKERIAFLPKKDNWWGPAGKTGPCGPDTEMFFYTGSKIPKKFDPKDKKWVEIWNDVFMQYNKLENGKYVPLKQQNVDTGMGLERTAAVLQGKNNVYEIETFKPVISAIEKVSGKKFSGEGNVRVMRIIADHIKASVFVLNEGIVPSNLEQGYVLRKFIRRAIRYGRELEIKEHFVKKVAESVFKVYSDKDLQKNKERILKELENEEDKFEKVIISGLRKAEKLFKTKIPIKKEKFIKLQQHKDKIEILRKSLVNRVSKKPYAIKEANLSKKEIDLATIEGKEAFDLYQSFGFPIEMILELAREKFLFVDRASFRKELEKHQKLSRKSTEGKFKSGLADQSEETAKLHTATHLLHGALRKVLGEHVFQRGSNITAERLRFDFSHDSKLTDEEIKKVEDLVNQEIKKGIEVKRDEMKTDEAMKKGAIGVFGGRYGEKVTVFSIGRFDKEICAGPHVDNTKKLGKFKIIKQESVAAGVRRIKAVLVKS